jgi:tetratricopeptide (TPR) repeat protein
MRCHSQPAAKLLFSCALFLFASTLHAENHSVSILAPQSSSSADAARRLFDAGNYAAAIAALKSAIAQNPNDAQAHYWLGRSYYETKNIDNAVTEGERSVALDAKNSDYHRWLGEYYGEQADRQHSYFLARKVKKEFEDAVKANPSNIEARRDLEEFNIQAPWIVGGSKDAAREQVDAIAAIDPVEGHLARAVYDAEVLKKTDLADNEYHLALDAHPAKIDPYIEIADVYRQLNRPADMELPLQGAEKVKPGDPRIGFYRAVQRILANNQASSSEPLLKSYLATTPDRSDWPSHASARYWLGRVYEQQGKRQEAAEQYRAALQLDSGYKDARTRLQSLEKNSK